MPVNLSICQSVAIVCDCGSSYVSKTKVRRRTDLLSVQNYYSYAAIFKTING